jgi:hypothetical protein
LEIAAEHVSRRLVRSRRSNAFQNRRTQLNSDCPLKDPLAAIAVFGFVDTRHFGFRPTASVLRRQNCVNPALTHLVRINQPLFEILFKAEPGFSNICKECAVRLRKITGSRDTPISIVFSLFAKRTQIFAEY